MLRGTNRTTPAGLCRPAQAGGALVASVAAGPAPAKQRPRGPGRELPTENRVSKEACVDIGGLSVARTLHDFIRDEAIPGSGITPEAFWSELADIVRDFAPRNRALLDKRDALQERIDAWHRERRGQPHDAAAYQAFLEEIGYLVPEPAAFQVTSANVDREIAHIAGPQLVVPLDNARYVLNAVNARWGSLYNALYSTDAIPQSDGCRRIKRYNPIRGEKVIAYVRTLLNRNFPLEKYSHFHATRYYVEKGELMVEMGDGNCTPLLRPEAFVGYRGPKERPTLVLLEKHGLHLELHFGEGLYIGRRDHAQLYDVQIESAITAIMDCEDSVASVDVEDKLRVYRNWLGLMRGDLKVDFERDGEQVARAMEPDHEYLDPQGKPFTLSGRSLMLVRNVGMQLETDAVLLDGAPIPETLLDAMVTVLCAKHDLLGTGVLRNSRLGSVYVVKPKMHGPEEVALANELFGRVEKALGLLRNTLKMGIMDEERRTSVNLRACIREAAERVVFINTGFLDRTGDEIHTCMEAGPVLPRAEMKNATWLAAYEDSNVDIGLACGLIGHAQIGKGMWAAPDEMMAMLETKIRHLKAGANTAWVPSPTAASLHAIHYLRFNVHSRQEELRQRTPAKVEDILTLPRIPADRSLRPEEIEAELENNAQGILGYVARWVGQGVGCSKVPDYHNVALMEDCATLRISSQYIANWLHHGIVTPEQVERAMRRMAIFVDRQNKGVAGYHPMSDHLDTSIPFLAALDLALKGRTQPNGYTEFILYARRREMKASL
jgi:malate synthase